MNRYLTKVMIYHQVHQMNRDGFSIAYISQFLGINWRTAKRLLAIEDDRDYERLLQDSNDRNRLLQPYESFVKSKLEQYRDTSSAQMHDWLKEHFKDFPGVSPKTVFNFVASVRQKYHLLKMDPVRDCQMVEESPYGLQAQVDFGEYNLRDNHGKGVRVFFFTMVLSRSRYKYIWFSAQRFTAGTAILAHESAFVFMGGIPDVIVYDQDRVFIVDENKGDIILTDSFKAYTRERKFKLHFCRKADPQSKGKVENVVKYVKQNFLYNRPFEDIGSLNAEALCWLGRTANQMVHSGTKKQPSAEWEIEKQFLQDLSPLPAAKTAPQLYTVRIDNSISYKANFYSLPLGTYKGKASQVKVLIESNSLVVYDLSDVLLCRHVIALGKGQKVMNTDHKRDKSSAIAELIEQVCTLVNEPEKGRLFLKAIHSQKPRYIRDQILLMKETIEKSENRVVDQALDYCCRHHISSASDFKSIVQHYTTLKPSPDTADNKTAINPLNGKMPDQALVQPATSSINDYDMF